MSYKEAKIKPEEAIYNFRELIEKRFTKFKEKTAFEYKENGVIKEITYGQYINDIKSLGTALLDLGVKRIAVIGNNRYEWVTSYLAITTSGLIVVPLDKALPDKEIEKLVKRSGVEAIIYEEKYQDAIDYCIEKGCNLKYKICMDNIDKEEVIKYNQLLKKGEELVKKGDNRYDKIEIEKGKMYILLFTSGTTSEPKAVMLSQNNICENLNAIAAHFKIYSRDVLLSFLPIHHTFECSFTFLSGTYSGATIAFCEGLRYIAQNLKDYKVTIFVAVPLVLETMYKKIQKGIAESGKKGLIDKMTTISNGLLKCKVDLRKILFKAVRKEFDEYLRIVIVGAAPLDKNTIIGYNNLGVDIIQGYGLTEASPVVTAERLGKQRPGAIGIPLCNIELKIDNPDKNGVGELLVKGPNVMLGYYENENATKKAIQDGWLYTGDYAYIDKDGFVFITGRQSDIIVLKNGKNIYPQEIEFLINKLPYVEESMVYSKEKTKTNTILCAKLVYNEDEIKSYLGEKTQEEYKKLIWNEIKKINKDLPAFKHIKEIIITTEPFEKTTTQKVKRYVEIKKIERQAS